MSGNIIIQIIAKRDMSSKIVPGGKATDGESSGEDNRKRTASTADDNGSATDSQEGGRRSRRKRTKVLGLCTLTIYVVNIAI